MRAVRREGRKERSRKGGGDRDREGKRGERISLQGGTQSSFSVSIVGLASVCR